MIKWLLISALTANVMALFWFSSQEDSTPKGILDEGHWQVGLASEIVLLSELEITPATRGLRTAEARWLDELVPEELGAHELGGIESSMKYENVGQQTVADAGSSELVDSQKVNEGDSFQEGVSEKGALLESRPQPKSEPEVISEVGLGLQCVALGRFDRGQDANALLEKLQQAVGVEAKVQAVAEGVVRYLVYMGPFETQAMAKEQQAILKEGGVRSSLYYKGDLQNSLSLGYFGSHSNAGRRFERLLAAGHGVELKTIETRVVRYWIELQRLEDVKLSQNFWRDMAEKFPTVTRKDVACSATGQEGQVE
ncbi:MAG: hypothetical protein COA75_11035 [Cellvibrionales bacterium]|nr:MAG: hypothetical protein COA75_11035 [Cellvibrionales bacterium]